MTTGSLRNLIGGNEFEKQLREEKRLGTLQEWLRFAAIDYRKADIAEHHEKTFQWVFQSTSTPVEENVAGSYFVEWLQHGKGLYWIQGTLGSGKSTLMRYIVEHSSLQSHLRTWACGSTLHVASFFFTKTGPEVLQRSLQGLYRTLLESLIRGNEELAWVAFPGWRASDRHAPDPPVGLLRDALQRILRSHTGSQKFCFLIDGLDEYEEDDSVLRTKLAKDVLKLAKLPGMKILVASRPEASFVDCFSDCPTMELHRLTKRDITRYVKAELDHDDRTKSLTRLDAAKLAAEIVRKARGVFLWVILAVANILDGVMFGETYLDIQAQISTLHNDLYQAFKQVLSVRIQFQYRQEVARCLKMASHHRKYVYWTTSYHRYGLGSRHGPTDPKLCSLAAYTIGRRIDRSDTYNHLLLAIEDPNELDRQINTLRKNLPRRSCGLFTWTSSGMSLLHSSMDEFLDRPEVAEFLQNQAGEDFDVALALVAGRVADLVATLHGMSEAEAAASNRGLSDPQQMKHLIMKHLLEILQCIELAYNPEKTALEELLLCLDRVLHKNWCVANLPRLVELTVGVDFMIELESTAGSFLLKGNLITLAVYHGCVRYIRHISQADRGLSSDGMLLFDMVNFGFLCATSFQSSASDELQGPDVHEQVKRSAHWSAPEQHNQSWDGSSHFSIAELLLEEGADPNRPASYIPSWAAKSKSQSPWQRALDGIHECTLAPLSQREPILQRAFSLARCMLEHGADPVYITGQWSGGRMIYTNLFEELLERTCCGHNKLQSCSCSSAARLQSQVLSLIDLAQAKRDEK